MEIYHRGVYLKSDNFGYIMKILNKERILKLQVLNQSEYNKLLELAALDYILSQQKVYKPAKISMKAQKEDKKDISPQPPIPHIRNNRNLNLSGSDSSDYSSDISDLSIQDNNMPRIGGNHPFMRILLEDGRMDINDELIQVLNQDFTVIPIINQLHIKTHSIMHQQLNDQTHTSQLMEKTEEQMIHFTVFFKESIESQVKKSSIDAQISTSNCNLRLKIFEKILEQTLKNEQLNLEQLSIYYRGREIGEDSNLLMEQIGMLKNCSLQMKHLTLSILVIKKENYESQKFEAKSLAEKFKPVPASVVKPFAKSTFNQNQTLTQNVSNTFDQKEFAIQRSQQLLSNHRFILNGQQDRERWERVRRQRLQRLNIIE
eukprot:403347181